MVLSCIVKEQLPADTSENATLIHCIGLARCKAFRLRANAVPGCERGTVSDRHVFRWDKIVVPTTLTSELVLFLCEGHLGITRTAQRFERNFHGPEWMQRR